MIYNTSIPPEKVKIVKFVIPLLSLFSLFQAYWRNKCVAFSPGYFATKPRCVSHTQACVKTQRGWLAREVAQR